MLSAFKKLLGTGRLRRRNINTDRMRLKPSFCKRKRLGVVYRSEYVLYSDGGFASLRRKKKRLSLLSAMGVRSRLPPVSDTVSASFMYNTYEKL